MLNLHAAWAKTLSAHSQVLSRKRTRVNPPMSSYKYYSTNATTHFSKPRTPHPKIIHPQSKHHPRNQAYIEIYTNRCSIPTSFHGAIVRDNYFNLMTNRFYNHNNGFHSFSFGFVGTCWCLRITDFVSVLLDIGIYVGWDVWYVFNYGGVCEVGFSWREWWCGFWIS